MSFMDAKSVIDYLVGFWKSHPASSKNPQTYISFYGGEPLLNFTLIKQVVEYVESIDIKRSFQFSMTSNCILLKRYMDFLVEHNFKLLCSLDGDKKSDAYRINKIGSPSYDIVYGNIKLLQEKHPSYFHNNVSFNAVLHNLNNVHDICLFFKKEFGKIPMLSALNTVGIKEEKKTEFERMFNNLYDEMHLPENKELLINDLAFSDPGALNEWFYIEKELENTFTSYLELFNSDDDYYRCPTGTCIPFMKKMFVKVDGKILQCERIPHYYSLGNVNDSIVHLDVNEICQYINNLYDSIQDSCSACGLKKDCTMCMFNIMDMEKGSPKCDEYMHPSNRRLYKLSRRSYFFEHPEMYRKLLEEFYFKR